MCVCVDIFQKFTPTDCTSARHGTAGRRRDGCSYMRYCVPVQTFSINIKIGISDDDDDVRRVWGKGGLEYRATHSHNPYHHHSAIFPFFFFNVIGFSECSIYDTRRATSRAKICEKSQIVNSEKFTGRALCVILFIMAMLCIYLCATRYLRKEVR